MSDISMCANKECTLKETCYRFKAIPNTHWQSYASFKQDEKGKCNDYQKVRKPILKK